MKLERGHEWGKLVLRHGKRCTHMNNMYNNRTHMKRMGKWWWRYASLEGNREVGRKGEQEYMGRLKQDKVFEYSVRKHAALGTN